MATILITKIKQYMGLSTDPKPANTPEETIYPGSTLHHYDTGAQFIWDGANWQDDLRLIYALEHGIT